jgi:transcriptional regulator with XRE-family HTH domain
MFQNRIKEIRQEKGLSQSKLARMVDIAEPSLCQIERGQRAPWPKVKRLLSAKLGVTETELFPES